MKSQDAFLAPEELVAIFTRHVPPTEDDLREAERYMKTHPRACVRIVGMTTPEDPNQTHGGAQ